MISGRHGGDRRSEAPTNGQFSTCLSTCFLLFAGQSVGLGIGAICIHFIFPSYINIFIRLSWFAAGVNAVKCIHFYRTDAIFFSD